MDKKKVLGFLGFIFFVGIFPLFSLLSSVFGLQRHKDVVAELSKYKDMPAVGNFSMVNQQGDTIGRDIMDGKLTVMHFFFTKCPGACPKTMEEVSRAFKEFRKNREKRVVFLSFSVDPTHDTPGVLKEYGSKYGVDSTEWHLLTGDSATIFRLMNNDLKLGALENRGQSTDPIDHSTYLTLLDTAGKIRSYYDGLKPEEVNRMMEHISYLVPKKKKETLEYRAEKEK